ncbi:hypothetical protein ScalyP_jg10177 [Parmales sp. scaly parma]|nr:hypothetical protein ScalyP_jg10177 [Parmales sp. scaly parma]
MISQLSLQHARLSKQFSSLAILEPMSPPRSSSSQPSQTQLQSLGHSLVTDSLFLIGDLLQSNPTSATDFTLTGLLEIECITATHLKLRVFLAAYATLIKSPLAHNQRLTVSPTGLLTIDTDLAPTFAKTLTMTTASVHVHCRIIASAPFASRHTHARTHTHSPSRATVKDVEIFSDSKGQAKGQTNLTICFLEFSQTVRVQKIIARQSNALPPHNLTQTQSVVSIDSKTEVSTISFQLFDVAPCRTKQESPVVEVDIVVHM